MVVKVRFRIKINGEWIIKEAFANSEEAIKEFCRDNDKIEDWEIISTEELSK